jgi:hypothetical protein
MKKIITAIMTKSRGFMMGIYQSLHDHVKMIMGAFTAIPNKTLPVLFSPKACMPIPFMIEVLLTMEPNDPMLKPIPIITPLEPGV